ncbi:Uncharacterised protein [Bacteroides eggerthii]|uniref:Uncharacterized protein n=1 Tax=Bacteroides eggerthii TaxID=28111 RepID=A0A380ZQF8_9BACE|nr:Uncharacterised protein [Bacteroides eggerthii]
MSNVATHDDSTVQRQAGGNRILGQLLQDILHRLVQIDLHHITLAGLTEFGRDKFSRIAVELFNPDTFFIDFTLDVTVCRAGNAQTDRTGSTMTRQTDDTHIVSQILAAELCAKTNLMSLCQYLLLQFHVAESTTELITGSRQVVIEVSGRQFHRQQVLLCRSAADDECNVIGRTSSRTQRLYLFDEERNQCFGVQYSLGLLIKVGLVGRTSTLSHTKELILHAFGGFNVDLCRKIALRIHFIVHIERRILGITQVLFRICLVDTE